MPAADSKVLKPHRVFLVDDHPLVRRGLQGLIQLEPSLVVCGEAEGEVDALSGVSRLKPDVMVVDLILRQGSGLELLRQVQQQSPNVRSVVLSMHHDLSYIRRALRLGARAYVRKEEGMETIVQAIQTVLDGKMYISQDTTVRWIPEKIMSSGGASNPIDRLTHRELLILELLGHGFSTNEIGTSLAISVATVESHRHRIKSKLGIKCATELLHRAHLWVYPAFHRRALLSFS